MRAADETFGRWGMGLRALVAIGIAYTLVLSHRNLPSVLVVLAVSGLPALTRVRLSGWAWGVFGFIAWAALTALWSPYSDRWDWPVNLAILGAVSAAVAPISAPRSFRWIVWGVLAASFLLFVEALSGGIIRDLLPPDNRPDKDDVATARGIGCLVLMMPAVALMAYRWWGRGALFIVVAATIFMGSRFGITANLLAAVAGAMAAGLAYFWPRLTLRMLLVSGIAGFVLMPLFAAALPTVDTMMEWTAGPASWRMRLTAWKEIWNGLGDGNVLHLIFGHGVEAGRVLGDTLGGRLLPGAVLPSRAIPTHPHNIFLQVWYDLGLVGALLSAGALYLGFRQLLAAQLQRESVMAVAALSSAILVFAAVDASLWTLWRVAAPVLGGWMLFQIVKYNNFAKFDANAIAPQQR